MSEDIVARYTRKATVDEQQAYQRLRQASPNLKRADELKSAYVRGAGRRTGWTGTAEQFDEWCRALDRWKKEQAAAGFLVSTTGLRVYLSKPEQVK